MFKLLRLLYDPGEGGAAGGGVVTDPPVSDGLDLSSKFENVEETPRVDNPPEPVKEEKPKEPAPAVDEDPEHEIDYESEPGKKAKVKLSELKRDASWLRSNTQFIQGALKIREEAQKNPSFGKAMQTLINKAYNEKGEFQPEYVDKLITQLEGQERKIEDKIDDKTDDIAEMEKMLEELDAESPNAQILKRNISAARRIRQELNTALEQNKKFQERLDGLDKFKDGLINEKTEAEKTAQVKQLSSVYDREVGALCDPAKNDGYKFVDEEEKGDFDRAVREGIAAKSDAIKNDEEFVKVIKEVAKTVYDRMTKRREAYVTDYLRKKNGPPKEEKKDKPKEDTRTFEEKLQGVDFTQAPS